MPNLLMSKSEGVVKHISNLDEDIAIVTIFDEGRQMDVQEYVSRNDQELKVGDRVDITLNFMGFLRGENASGLDFKPQKKEQIPVLTR